MRVSGPPGQTTQSRLSVTVEAERKLKFKARAVRFIVCEADLAAVRADDRTAKRKAAKAASGADELSSEDQELYETLRAVRTRLAAVRSVPAYVIFNDAALRGMCLRNPKTADEMLEVSGVGLAKMRAYGDEFLRAIRKYQEKAEQKG